jgi:hypothetical protein
LYKYRSKKSIKDDWIENLISIVINTTTITETCISFDLRIKYLLNVNTHIDACISYKEIFTIQNEKKNFLEVNKL